MPAPLDLHNTLIPDAWLAVAELYPDRAFARVLENDTVQIITWKQLLRDSQVVATYLQTEASSPPRSPGDERLTTVGIIGTSSYAYYVQIIACFLLGWTVSKMCFSFRWTCRSVDIHSLSSYQ
jgi:acyl-CoA synthetase (AMP-forming)/AMP-acid ligase II